MSFVNASSSVSLLSSSVGDEFSAAVSVGDFAATAPCLETPHATATRRSVNESRGAENHTQLTDSVAPFNCAVISSPVNDVRFSNTAATISI
jgi:hypothetical protein